MSDVNRICDGYAQRVYGFIGTGALTAAMVEGFCRHGSTSMSFRLSPRNKDAAAELAARYPNVQVCADNQAVIDASAVVVLAVRPQDANEVFRTLRFSPHHTVISVMAGIPLEAVKALSGDVAAVVCAAPLASANEGASITPVYPRNVIAREMFARLGEVIELDDESLFAAFFSATATVASWYAYLGSISHWLEAAGVGASDARRHVATMFRGLARSLDGEHDFEVLAKHHATKDGINEQLLRELRGNRVFDHVASGLDGIRARVQGRRN